MNCPHCKTEIDEHEANRCLDAWVAETVMGGGIVAIADTPSVIQSEILKDFAWNVPHDNYPGFLTKPLPLFSTDIAAAWEVVTNLYGRNGGYFMLERFDSELGGDWRSVLGVEDVDGIAPTAPLAICRAALKAKG